MVTADRWKSMIDHVMVKVEDHYWDKDGLFEEQAFEFIVQLTKSHFEDNSSDSDSDSDSD